MGVQQRATTRKTTKGGMRLEWGVGSGCELFDFALQLQYCTSIITNCNNNCFCYSSVIHIGMLEIYEVCTARQNDIATRASIVLASAQPSSSSRPGSGSQRRTYTYTLTHKFTHTNKYIFLSVRHFAIVIVVVVGGGFTAELRV